MKFTKLTKQIITSLLLTASFSIAQSEDGYINWIKQVQVTENSLGESIEVTRQLSDLEHIGTAASPLGIATTGATFYLYTMNSETGQEWLLDSVDVGAYKLPSAEIKVIAPDQDGDIYRTDAATGFSVETEFVDISAPGENIVEEATKLNYSGRIEDASGNVLSTLWNQSITQNGVVENVPNNGNGEIVPDSVGSFTTPGIVKFEVGRAEMLKEASIEVYPVPTGEIIDFSPESNVISSIPTEIEIEVNDSYPNSEIRVLIEIERAGELVGEFELKPTNVSEWLENQTYTFNTDTLDSLIIDDENLNTTSDAEATENVSNFAFESGDIVTFKALSSSFRDVLLDQNDKVMDTQLVINSSIVTSE